MRLFLIVVLPAIAFGFEEYKLPFTCSADDVQWAGMTCSESEPCPVYLELATVGSAGQSIFVAGNIHSAQSTLYSILLRSNDGGATWKEPVGRTRGEELDHIQFENPETGWVSGQRVVPLPGDPFFLITHDGGENWHKSPVLAEGSAGFIQKFRFDSATQGKLLIDRGAHVGTDDGDEMQYELLETKDGAESWTKLEASGKPIPAAPSPVDDNLWRLRAEASGKSFAVEHNVGGKWVNAASFAIQIAQCKES